MCIILYSSFYEPFPENALADLLNELPLAIQHQVKKYRRWQDAHACLLGKHLLKKGCDDLSILFDWNDIAYNDYNKPYLKDYPIHFNISHSGNIVVCAFSKTGPLGLDIEKINSLEITDFKEQFLAYEWEDITKNGPSLSRFYAYWTMKEAIIKAEGKGLSIPLKEIDLKSSQVRYENNTWHISPILIDNDYVCHLATGSPVDHVKAERIKF